MNAEGKFKNGDLWTGHKYQEENVWWFIAVDSNGNEYETDEIPETEPLFTMMRFRDGAPEAEVRDQMDFMCHCNAEHAHMTWVAHEEDCPANPQAVRCPQCNWPTTDGLCKECGYVLELGYHVKTKPGRCANGSELGAGTRWHAVLPDNYKAVCGTEPGRRTPGWSSWHNSKEVTCPACLKKLNQKV